MAKSEIIPVQPFPADIVDRLEAEQRNHCEVAAYPRYLERKFWGSAVRQSLAGVAELVEPIDRLTGADPAKPHAKAFYRGSLLGLRAVAECVNSVDAAFRGIKLEVSESQDEDNLHARHTFATGIINIGRQGYACVDEIFTALFDKWDVSLQPDATHHLYLHSGFGLPIAYLERRKMWNDEIQQELDLQKMEQMAQNPDTINWDELLI